MNFFISCLFHSCNERVFICYAPISPNSSHQSPRKSQHYDYDHVVYKMKYNFPNISCPDIANQSGKNSQRSSIDQWESELLSYCLFIFCRVFLISSVPGRHIGDKKSSFGHLKMRKVNLFAQLIYITIIFFIFLIL